MSSFPRPLLLLCAAACFAAAGGRADQVSGTATGELTVAGETAKLTHAYALEMDDAEGLRMKGTPRKAIVLEFSDVELPPDTVGSIFRSIGLAREGKLRGFELRMDAATHKPFEGSIYFPASEKEAPNLTVTLSGASDTYVVKELKFENGTVSGTLLMTKAEEWPRFAQKEKPDTFQYQVTFTAPLQRQPAVTASLAGPQAKASAPVLAFLQFEAACRKGDLATARKLASPAVTASWDPEIARGGLAAFKKSMQAVMPDNAKRRASITRVVIRGNRATVLFKDGDGQSWQPMVKQSSGWKVDEP